MKVVLAIDLGTTGNRVIAFSRSGEIIAQSYYEFPQIFPRPGWVEQDPLDIWETITQALHDVLAEVRAENVVSIGVTNQRETTILWETRTGRPVYNAIVWQDRRTKPFCEQLADSRELIRRKTGLFLDPYFSGTKIKWILDHVEGVQRQAEKGEVIFGTVDSWVLWNLTKGKVHATESSNASRTLCYNIHTLDYDDELIRLLGLPKSVLPEVKDSGGVFGYTASDVTGREIPVAGILGDQQASLFAQGGWQEGIIKNTYGTGLFVMTATGSTVPHAGRLVNTIAWKIDGEVAYAIEGSIFVGGSCVQWLRDSLHLVGSAGETEGMAQSLDSNEGVYFVPALVGMGAPYWDPTARGMLIGLTRGTTPSHIARAALEALAYQTRDVIEEVKRVIPERKLTALRVDGGAVQNNFLMQFQADILDLAVERPAVIDTTAFGAAGIAGITSGFWNTEEFLKARRVDTVFTPRMKDHQREQFYHQWKDAVTRAMNWARE